MKWLKKIFKWSELFFTNPLLSKVLNNSSTMTEDEVDRKIMEKIRIQNEG